jgi:hypothetical protein
LFDFIREDSTNIVFAGSCFGENFLSIDGGYTWTLTDVLVRPSTGKAIVKLPGLISVIETIGGLCCDNISFSY